MQLPLHGMAKKKPDKWALYLGHAVVGVVVTWAAGKVFKAAVRAEIVVGVVGVLAHAELDVPVSQAISDLGI